MKKLETLKISNTNVSDISILKDIDNIQILDISGCPISDYSVLAECENLETVYADNDKIPPEIIKYLQEKNISLHLND